MKNVLLLAMSLILSLNYVIAQQVSGYITDETGSPLIGATIIDNNSSKGNVTNNNGYYSISLAPGTYTFIASYVGCVSDTATIRIQKNEIVKHDFVLSLNTMLNSVVITTDRDFNNVKRMDEIEGTLIFAGKRNDVVVLDKTNANTSENIPRQVFSKVPGVYQWDLDGSGTQTSIAVRGLSPHRSWEFNVRQNGYNVGSDVFGYPESHYGPATEALKSVQLVRGGACLQYGPQYGGMLNYVMKEGPTDEKFDFETRQSFGSNQMFNSYNAVGGTVGKFNYYSYFNYRGSDGYRPNSRYDYYTFFAGFHYQATEKLKLGFEFSKMYYVNQLAGGLTDAQFEADPYQSTRSRNYFQPNHNIPAFTLDWNINAQTTLSLKTNALFGERNSVMYIKPANVPDTISATTLQYAPRTVDLDTYKSLTNELRILHRYTLGGRESALSAGIRFSDSYTHRQQGGEGTTYTDFDLTVTNPFEIDLGFKTLNYAVSAENLFRITDKLSITPGVRYEIINTHMEGDIETAVLPINYNKNRTMPLLGLGLQYDVNEQINLYGNWTQAYRPILYSDLTPVGSLDIVDPDMTDSKGFNSDLGIRGKISEFLTFDIGIFYLKYGDRVGALALTNSDNDLYIYKTNIGTSIAKGVESFIEFRPTKVGSAPSNIGDIAIFVSASYNHAEYVDAITSANGQSVQLEGNVLENAPEWIVRTGITYNNKIFSTTLQSSYVSEVYADALNTESSASGVTGIVPSYMILDWNSTVRFSSQYILKFGVNNLNNAVYFTRRINNYPGPGILPADGRTFYLSIGKEF